MFTVHFVRHGEVANPNRVKYGRLPRYRLSETGKLQATRAAETLSEHRISAIFCSPLLRARQTAQPIAAVHKLNTRLSTLLNEVLSPYEGWPIAEVLKIQDIYDNILRNMNDRPIWFAGPGSSFFEFPGSSLMGKS